MADGAGIGRLTRVGNDYRVGLVEGEALFEIDRIGVCATVPIEARVTLIRGDRFTLVADWTAGQRNEMRLQMIS